MLTSKKSTDSNQIDAPESDYLYTAVSQLPNAGNGLFTAIDIYKDEIIAVFNGEILTDVAATSKAKKGENAYFMNLINGKILDCQSTNGFAKYANDANGFAQSSFKNKSKIALDEGNNVCLIATSKIKMGEEIFCSYGRKYWKARAKPIL
ncbi:SET domain-containing protein [Flavobacterium sp.]|uniref:SET domain-containing protein n=1 Tax=Flavobacterium sp. TaxID=239 RepID=UPI00286D30EC|nr:SET domain-containing protein [Flavobacterium sp.]